MLEEQEEELEENDELIIRAYAATGVSSSVQCGRSAPT